MPQDRRSRVRQQLLEDCEQYVLNYLPTHLLRIRDKSLVTRAELWEAERARVQGSIEENVDRFSQPRKQADVQQVAHATTPVQGHDPLETERDSYVRGLFRFAIFSHRWGEDEPQFRDVMYKTGTHTVGYEKLIRFCQRASIDFDCSYVWSDTCCIDKESSVELDEAIRSMYRWYSIATVCIIHLAASLTIDDFESDPWFRRGWTLQEILAPKEIRLYGKDWKPISPEKHPMGDKAIKGIWMAIEQVTGIPHRDLWHFSPSCDRIAEKMKWASQRRTTKIEDLAYSLLGLFNVSLPIAYGEGDKAWYRLMAVLANECTDASFFAWAGKPSPYSRALPSSPACYSKLDPRTPVDLFNRRHPSYRVTKLGVLIQMLTVPIRWTVLEDGTGREMGYNVVPHSLEPFLVAANMPRGRVDEHKLGIINFRVENNALGLVAVDDECHCVLLAREHFADQGWMMVNTECVVVTRCIEEISALLETVLLYHDTLPSGQTYRYHSSIDVVAES